jgi:F-type H+-transporting ATPase subunit delta
MRRPKLAKRYANAFFEFAVEQDKLERVHVDIELINSTIEQNKDLQSVIASPIVHQNKKITIIREIFESQIDELTLLYLLLLLKKGRELQMDLICQEFHELYKQYKNIVTLYIESATVLDKETVNLLKSKIEGITDAVIEAIEVIIPNMIGGIRLKFKDNLIDASIQGSIERLRKELVDKSYQINF